MSPRPRLFIWIALVLLLVPGQLGWLYLLRGPSALARTPVLIWGQFVLGAACVGTLALLRTTPQDAIRLTPRASVSTVVGGTLLLQLAAIGLLVGLRPAASHATFAACAVAAVALLADALRRTGESTWYAALLGWNPLLTLGGVGEAGVADAIGVFLLAGVLAAAAAHRFKLAGAALALACAVKPPVLLLLPFLWRQVHERRSFRAGRRVVLVFLATLAVAVAPALLGRGPWAGGIGHVAGFGGAGEGNALIYESFTSLFGNDGDGSTRQAHAAGDAARLVGLLVVLGMGMLLWQSRATPAEAGYWLLTFGLLFAPAVGPHSLLWVLVFVPLVRGPQGVAALTWSATAAMGYAFASEGARSGSAPPPPPVWLVGEYLPVLCVLSVEVLRLARVVPLGRAIQNPNSAVPT